MKRLSALILILCFLLPLTAASSETAVVALEMRSVEIAEGGSCMFTAGQQGASRVEWRFMDPLTGEIVPAEQASAYFPGLTVVGVGTDAITLLNVPLEMDGWTVCCGASVSGAESAAAALIHVYYPVPGLQIGNAGANPTAAPAYDPVTKPLTGVPDSDTVRAVGAYVQLADKDGAPYGDRLETVPLNGGAVNVVITAKGKNVHSWIFNGVRYEFEDSVTRIVIRNVTEPLLIEPVIDGNPQTLKPIEQIQSCRTGEKLIVKSINAKMNFMRDQKNSAGTSFREFDFTSDYLNEATGSQETGGQITVKVTGQPPERYYKVYGWKFNDMRLTFNGEVKFFIVHTLDCSMTYEPLLQKVPAGTAW